MSDDTDDLPDEVDKDLLPDDLQPGAAAPKKNAVPMVRTPAQIKAAEKAAAKQAVQSQAARLAQIVNLHIAGYSLADIGASIGATADEVDRMLSADAARYVRNQPALRTYVRNYISGKITKMIEADWEQAVDPTHNQKLEHQDRVMRMLNQMAKLHGAEAPTQAEVTIDAAPEAVERLVSALAASQGLGYDTDVFDLDDDDITETVHAAVVQTAEATVVSGNRVEQAEEGDPDDGF